MGGKIDREPGVAGVNPAFPERIILRETTPENCNPVGLPEGLKAWQARPIVGECEFIQKGIYDAALPGFLICDGCGSSMTDEELAALREKRPETRSCCPERRMRPATREDWVALRQRGLLATEDAEGRWVADTEAGVYDEDLPEDGVFVLQAFTITPELPGASFLNPDLAAAIKAQGDAE